MATIEVPDSIAKRCPRLMEWLSAPPPGQEDLVYELESRLLAHSTGASTSAEFENREAAQVDAVDSNRTGWRGLDVWPKLETARVDESKFEVIVSIDYLKLMPESDAERHEFLDTAIRSALAQRRWLPDANGCDKETGAYAKSKLLEDHYAALNHDKVSSMTYLVVNATLGLALQHLRDANDGREISYVNALKRFVVWLRATYPDSPVYRLDTGSFVVRLDSAPLTKPTWIDGSPLKFATLQLECRYPFHNAGSDITVWLQAALGEASFDGRVVTLRLVDETDEARAIRHRLAQVLALEAKRRDERENMEGPR